MPTKKTAKKKSPVKPKTVKKRAAAVSRTSLTNESAGLSFHQVYMELRTKLDSIESVSLYYVLSGTDDEERTQRAKEVMDVLRKPIEEVELLNDPDGYCPDGYRLCNGVCVPYPCS